MPVAYTEYQGSPTEKLTPTKFTAQRKLKCAWADRLTLMLELRGSAYAPWPTALCNNCYQEPVDGKNIGTGDTSAYEFAIIVANYETPTYSGTSENYTENIEPFSQFLLIDSTNFCFEGATVRTGLTPGDQPQGESAGLLFGGCVYTHTKLDVLSVPDIQGYLDHVNSVAITPKKSDLANHWNFAIGTLLFCAPSIDELTSTPGHWKITYKCKWRPQGWNKFWNPNTGLYESLIGCRRLSGFAPAGAYPNAEADELLEKYPEEPFTPYQSANFSGLFH